jgi:hypothetical protein
MGICSSTHISEEVVDETLHDGFADFVSVHCVRKTNHWVMFAVLHSAFVTFMRQRNVTYISPQQFYRLLIENGFVLSGHVTLPVVLDLELSMFPHHAPPH